MYIKNMIFCPLKKKINENTCHFFSYFCGAKTPHPMMSIITSRPTLFLETGEYTFSRFLDALLSIPVLIAYEIISDLYNGNELWQKVLAISLIIVLGTLLLHTILWRLFGKETITFGDENLIIVRKLLFLRKKIIIPGKDIQSVMENPRPLSQKRILIQCSGNVKYLCGYNIDSKDLNDIFDVFEIRFFTEK